MKAHLNPSVGHASTVKELDVERDFTPEQHRQLETLLAHYDAMDAKQPTKHATKQPSNAWEVLKAGLKKVDFLKVFRVVATFVSACMTLFIFYTTLAYIQVDLVGSIPAIGWLAISCFFFMMTFIVPDSWLWLIVLFVIGNLGVIQLV